MKIKTIFLLIVISVLLLQWGTSPEDNVQLTRTDNLQLFGYNAAVSSPSGRIFLFYFNNPNIWVQGLSPSGIPLWPGDGKPIYQKSIINGIPVAISDGEGGAIVIWKAYHDRFYNSSLRAQRIDQDGNLLWGTNGVIVSDLKNVCGEILYENFISIASDGAGGAYVAYDVNDIGYVPYYLPENRIYLQRLNSRGERVFGSGGVQIAPSDRSQFIFSWQAMTGDGENGVIISWIDNCYGNPAVLAQRINKNGEKLWSEPGVIICQPQPGKRVFQSVVSDSKGGAIIAWRDKRPELTEFAIYAQRIDKDGNVLWKEDGRFAGVASFSYYWTGYSYWVEFFNTSLYHMIEDGYGGAIFSWHGQEGIFVQRLDENGNRMWDMDGKQVTPYINYWCQWQLMGRYPSGKYIITWYDPHSIYAQIFDRDGNFYLDGNERIISRGLWAYLSYGFWAVNPVFDGTGMVIFFQIINISKAGSAYDWNLYALRVLDDGKLGYGTPNQQSGFLKNNLKSNLKPVD